MRWYHKKPMTATTPMMNQWHECKAKAKTALLLFRLGDFYEAFYEDAALMSKEIGLTLTARQGIPMCGVPFHTAETYIDKLIAKGFRVAVAEQTEDPKSTKGLVKREIVRIVSPGTIVNSQLLSDKKNNFFASIAKCGSIFGIGLLDLTTAEFRAFELEKEQDLIDEIFRSRPSEFLVSKRFKEEHPLFFQELSHSFTFVVNEKEAFDLKLSQDALSSHFKDLSPLKGQTAALLASGALLLHLKEDLRIPLDPITQIQTESLSSFMSIDRATLRNLELTESMGGSSSKNTLFELLDETATPIGARCLRHWLKHPLLSCSEIISRQDAVQTLLAHPLSAKSARAALDSVRDLERLLIKITGRYAGPRDLFRLGKSLSQVPFLKEALFSLPSEKIQSHLADLFDCKGLADQILSSISETPPLRIGEGDIFKDGVDPELDSLRQLARDSVSWMARYQIRLREETGIKTLKVSFTKAFGYYIEVTRAQVDKIPPSFERRQTLVNAERFITPELKEFEHRALTAEERSKALEAELYEKMRAKVASQSLLISKTAKAIAHIDALLSLAKAAEKYQFVRPEIDSSDALEIVEGRHPIIEKSIGSSLFIPNDTELNQKQQMMLITGPNMAGKYTSIKQG